MMLTVAVRRDPPSQRSTRISYLLEAAPGGTRLTNEVALDPSPGVLRLAARLATPKVRAAVAENLSKLKEILEARNQRAGA
jgi:hypothetical protein